MDYNTLRRINYDDSLKLEKIFRKLATEFKLLIFYKYADERGAINKILRDALEEAYILGKNRILIENEEIVKNIIE